MSPKPYSESDDHVPNPLFQTGIVDTTGTSGDLGGRIENSSPVFAQAKADAFQNAVDAVDDPDRNEDEVVVFHEGEEGQPSREEGIENLRQAAKDAADNPQLENPAATPAAAEAAEEGDDEDDDSEDDDSEDDESEEDESEEDDLPADSASKAKWVAYAEENKLSVDQSLTPKDEFIKAVKAAKAAKK